MDRFANTGPIQDVGTVVERRQILRFFLGTVTLTGLVLILGTSLVLMITGYNFPFWPYFVILFLSLLTGGVGTILAIRAESEAVFVPYLRVTPEKGRIILRSPELVDEKNYEYHVILPTEAQGEVVRYQGRGESHKEVRLTKGQRQQRSQVEYDAQRFAELSKAVYISDISLS